MRVIVLHCKKFRVADVITALNLLEIDIDESADDIKIIKEINKMSSEDDLRFWTLLSNNELKNE